MAADLETRTIGGCRMMIHPSQVLPAEVVAALRDHAAAAEALGMLHPDQLAVVYQQQWFKLLVPQIHGGLETPLPALVRLQEAISWADGSAGWVVTLCCGAGWFGGFMDQGLAQQVFAAPQVCLAGSGAVTGEAEKTESGYRLNGSWNYASGAHHATHFTANCRIIQNGQELLEDGQPLVLPFIVPKDKVTLLPTWKYVGMVATGSHSFKMENVEVAEANAFRIDPKYARVAGALYQYPFLHLAEATLAVNLSGMAVHFTDLCADIFDEKAKQPKLTDAHRAKLEQELQLAIDSLQFARAELFKAVDASWITPGDRELQAVSTSSRHLAKTSRAAVDQLYPYCGLQAASPDTEVNRVWRDLHTAGQHALLTFDA